MDLTARRRNVQHKSIISDTLSDLYPTDLNFYLKSPSSNVQLAEFEDLAFERVQLLRIIEQASYKGIKAYSDDWKQCIKNDLIKANLKKYVRLMSGFGSNTDLDYQARRADHISHFVLRIAYCRSETLRRWFLSRELEWFKLRFISQSQQEIKRFLQLNNLIYTPISQEEKESIKDELINSYTGLTDVSVEVNEFYKVPFADVTSLVRNNKVYLKYGIAYIPLNDLVFCIQSKFRAHLSKQLNIYQHRLPNLDDDRITPLLANLHNVHIGNNYATQVDKDSIDPSNLDNFAKQHFPLCMRHMHENLRATHHAKHGCRMQYGLFLKGIGLLYDDAVKFWREEFTKLIDSNTFDKNYLYNISHQYGKVGNRVNYSSYSCIKIIMGSVGPGEHHGCPFRHWDPTLLTNKLLEYGISNASAKEVIDLVTSGHFQIACGKYFELTHNKAPMNSINHPNQYFEESRNLLKASNQNKKT